MSDDIEVDKPYKPYARLRVHGPFCIFGWYATAEEAFKAIDESQAKGNCAPQVVMLRVERPSSGENRTLKTTSTVEIREELAKLQGIYDARMATQQHDAKPTRRDWPVE